jgi:hypothetical protein
LPWNILKIGFIWQRQRRLFKLIEKAITENSTVLTDSRREYALHIPGRIMKNISMHWQQLNTKNVRK